MDFRILIMTCLLYLAACSHQPRAMHNWSPELPEVGIFLKAYEADQENQNAQSLENYLIWVKRFYQGWIVYDRGWLKMSSELEASIENEEKRVLASEKIQQIGLLIAPEWAKEKEGRYIRTRDVSVWGESLLEALSRGASIEFMNSVAADIALLRQGQIASDDIRIERYFPDLNDGEGFLFGF